MKEDSTLSSIHVENVNLWAHVGVLENERLLGQSFLLDFTVWIELDIAAKDDDISRTADYCLGVESIQQLAYDINCRTIEHFSEKILDKLESIYGLIPLQITLRKCAPPIEGFSGSVSIQRGRNMNFLRAQ